MNPTGISQPSYNNQNYYSYNNRGNNDLEANLLQDNAYGGNQEYGADPNLEEGGEQEPGAIPADFRSNLTYSVKWNVMLLLVSLGKVAASVAVLATSPFCLGAYQVWIILMALHDVFYSLMIITTIQLIRRVNGAMASLPSDDADPASQQENVQGSNQQLARLNNEGNNLEASPQNNGQLFRPEAENAPNNLDARLSNENIEMVRLARDITQKQRKIARLTALTDTGYVILFFIGQMIFFLSTGLSCETVEIRTLTLTYLLLGYLWLLSPILLFCLACLCLPVLLFVLILFGGRGSQVPATTALINNLEVKQFQGDLPSSNECSICMVDYEQGDNIIQLKCSPMHHFHEDCIKKWLQINGLCPICRTRLQDMKDEPAVTPTSS